MLAFVQRIHAETTSTFNWASQASILLAARLFAQTWLRGRQCQSLHVGTGQWLLDSGATPV
jgi:hypothetical protein